MGRASSLSYDLLKRQSLTSIRHLDGVYSLLNDTTLGISYMNQSLIPVISSADGFLSKAQRAAFWNFAREDYLAAYINHRRTRLDTENLIMWHRAGLALKGIGNSTTLDIDTIAIGPLALASNTLVYLLSKVMNAIATEAREDISMTGASQQNQNAEATGSNSSERNRILSSNSWTALWDRLQNDLSLWHTHLPPQFHTCIRLQPGLRHHEEPSLELTEYRIPFPELYYNVPICAATMQHYHFARILLLLNQLPNAESSRDPMLGHLRGYRRVSKELDSHVREICGIALARPPGAVRIHMLQPLYLAGLIVEGEEERRLVLELLHEIEEDLGWATQHRIQALRAEWGWETSYPLDQ